MYVEVLKSKIHRVTITETNLNCSCIAMATPEQRRFIMDFADRMLSEELIRA